MPEILGAYSDVFEEEKCIDDLQIQKISSDDIPYVDNFRQSTLNS